MLTRDHIENLFEAIYEDSALKNRLILWTFIVLVFPAAALVALGVPEKPTLVTMCLLFLPLQPVLYSLWKRQSSTIAEKGVFHAKHPIMNLTGTKPPPVMESTAAGSYASMNLACLIMARAARSGGPLPDDVWAQVSVLPGLRIPRNYVSRVGPDVVFRAGLMQQDGSWAEVWVRVGTRTPNQREPRSMEERLLEASEKIEIGDAPVVYGSRREDVMGVGLMLVSGRATS